MAFSLKTEDWEDKYKGAQRNPHYFLALISLWKGNFCFYEPPILSHETWHVHVQSIQNPKVHAVVLI